MSDTTAGLDQETQKTGEPETKTEEKKVEGDKLELTRSELDSLISKAVAKNQEKLQKSLEQKELEKAGDYQKLLDQERQKSRQLELRMTAAEIIAKNGLPSEMQDDLIALGDPEKMTSFADRLTKLTASLAEDKVRERIKSPAPPDTKTNQQPPGFLNDAKAYADFRMGRK